ncbi:thiamine pyrophosphate-binding protein [Marinitoga sp. 1154]|uniref:thiamine pyrophosphate-binding protein n=1 Tax=Marinitoga sp. 1154 TaxID=1643335 RepID=UPI001586D29F|nr:thiamine pyrophosphate-binding protein [Marinitoga sp. 1154]NUU99886.1 thiamine pyrophosphate-binding protein [Marinitoga sp. 1154]
MMKLSDYVFNFIANLGVKHVFMLPGGGCMHLVDSLGKNKRLKYITNLNEQAVSISVESYAQATNNIGVGLVTTGPGGTNAITGVAAGWVDSTPMLIISGQVKTKDMIKDSKLRQKGFQEIDIISLVKPITKYAVTITDAEDIRYHLEKAVYLATTGRPGPVWIDIPLDIQAAIIDEKKLKGYIPPKSNFDDDIDKKIELLIEMIKESKKPVILAGNGIRLAKAEKLFYSVIKKLNIPILLTWKAIDFLDENDPLNFGRPGAIASRYANFIQQKSDLFISIGARLDTGQTAYNHKNFAPYAKKVIVDVDKNEIDKLEMDIELKIVSDAYRFLDVLNRKIRKIEFKRKDKWLSFCKSLKNKYPIIKDEYYKMKDFVNPYVLIDILSKKLSENDAIIPGSSGLCSEITMQSFKVKKGQRVYNNEGFGAMGFGLPASIAGAIALNRRTICITGDGGIQMNIQELETLRRLNIPLKCFILDNKGYGSIVNTQNNYFNGNYVGSNESSGLTLPDMEKIAHAYGLKFYELRNNKDLINKIDEILDYEGPVICNVKIPEIYTTIPRTKSKIENGKIITLPMEDLWPYLDREEFNNIMSEKEGYYEI